MKRGRRRAFLGRAPGRKQSKPRAGAPALRRAAAFQRGSARAQDAWDGWLTFTQEKNARRKPVTLTIVVHPDLARIIQASPGSGSLAFLVTEFGHPFTANGFGNCFRKAAAARLAEAGATDREIIAVTGHATGKEVTRHTASVDQRKRAQRGYGEAG